MTMESIKDMASEMSSRMLFGKADILDMQAQMLTFGGITKENFPAIGDAIANVATKIGMDLHGMAIQFGKAMDNPSEGIKKLSRQGVLFSKEQADAIDKLVEKGKIVEAQQIMLTEIQNKYGGSSKAAYDASPLAAFTKRMGAFQVSVGEAAMEILEKLVPTLNYIADLFKSLGESIKEIIYWFEKHKIITDILTTFIGTLSSALFILYLKQKLVAMWTGIVSSSMVIQTFQMGVMSGALAGLSTAGSIYAGILAVINSINPFVWIVGSIVAVSTAVIYCYNHFEKFRATVDGLWEVMKRWGKNTAETILGLAELTSGNLTSGFKRLKDVFSNGGESTAQAFARGFDKSMQDFNKKTFQEHLKNSIDDFNKKVDSGLFQNLDEYNKKVSYFKTQLDKNVKSGLINETEEKNALGKLKGYTKGGLNTNAIKPTIEDKTKGVTGTKNVTINIAIGSLIHDFKINTTNIQESAKAIHDKVTQALTMAVGDSQITAGQ